MRFWVTVSAGMALGAQAGAGPVFEDRTAALGPRHVYDGGWEHFVGGGVSAFDCDGDGAPDLAAAGGAGPARLFVNRIEGRDWRFEGRDIAGTEGATGLWPLDVDGDGAIDLAVARVGRDLLLRGDGACGFAEANAAWGFGGGPEAGAAWSTAFSATWEPGRDWPTLAFGAYVDREDPDGPFGTCAPNVLHRWDGVRYVPRTLAPGHCALSILFSDWRREGRVGLRVSNDRHYYVSGGSEQMWVLDPLRLLGPEAGWDPVSIWGMGLASRDVTGDGVPEVMATSMGDQLLQIAGPDGYATAPYAMGVAAQRPFTGGDGRPSTGWHAEWADVDNDGLDDLFVAKGNVDQMPGMAMRDPNNLLMQRADGTFAEAAEAAGVASLARSRGAALADLDGDGRLDLAVVNRRAPMELWRNATEAGGAVSIDLAGRGGNRRGVGAWIEFEVAGRTRWREVTVGGGHGGGQALPHHFGIGDAGAARARVHWPDGAVSAWRDVVAGETVPIAQ